MKDPRKLEMAEDLLLRGDPAAALRLTRQVSSGPPPREWLPRLASLYRRLNHPEAALRLLSRYVRPFDREAVTLSLPEEVIQYAATLNYLGATGEGLLMLSSIPAQKFPEVYFHRALGLISQWRYADAIGELKSFLKTSPSGYWEVVAGINLLAAAIFEDRNDEAAALIPSLIQKTESWNLLRGNVLQLSAVLTIQNGRWNEAKQALEQAEAFLGQSARNLLFVRKWRAVLGLKTDSVAKRESWLSELKAVSRDADGAGQWETVRDCEKQLALASGKPERLMRVYVGTPHESYRAHLLQEWGRPVAIPLEYLWVLDGSARSKKVIDARPSQIAVGSPLYSQEILYRMVMALSSDFYRPLRFAELHSALYPQAHYHPEASPARVKTAANRLRRYLQEVGIKNGLEVRKNCYWFRRDAAFSVHFDRTALAPSDHRYQLLRQRLEPHAVFGAQEVSDKLGIPRRSVGRFLKTAVERGELVQEGAGRLTRYRLAR